MCQWHKRPKGQARRKTWLKRYLNGQRKRLLRGFNEAWYKRRHFTVAAQVKACLANIRRAEKELEVISA